MAMTTSLLPEWSALRHPVVGMLHAPALPGSPRYDGRWSAVRERVLGDAEALAIGGVDALMLENFGDVPFFPERVPAVTIAALTALAVAVRDRFPQPLGLNVLRNDGRSALAIAAVAGARFIRVNVLSGARVTDQGVVHGIAHDLLRDRAALGASAIRIWADVDVKHSASLAPRPLTEDTRDLVERAGADAVIVSGTATGATTSVHDLQQVRSAAGEAPILIGSGATLAALPTLLPLCDGFIVGTGFKRDAVVTNPVDIARVKDFVAAVHASE